MKSVQHLLAIILTAAILNLTLRTYHNYEIADKIFVITALALSGILTMTLLLESEWAVLFRKKKLPMIIEEHMVSEFFMKRLKEESDYVSAEQPIPTLEELTKQVQQIMQKNGFSTDPYRGYTAYAVINGPSLKIFINKNFRGGLAT